LHEFAYGASSVISYFGEVRNPWDVSRIAGGSSGGSAAAVAARLGYGAIGTDTAGSVRLPAAFCGVVGLKPTYGCVSARGVIPLSWSLDHVGTIGATVSDAAILLQAIAGYDPKDITSADVPVTDYVAALRENPKPLRVGVPRSFFLEDLDPEIAAGVNQALSVIQKLTGNVREVTLPVSTDRGYVVLTLKEVLPPHQGSLEDVREKVISELKQLKGTLQTQLKAKELENRVKGGEKFDAAAKALGLEPKLSEPFSRTGSLAGVGSGKQLAAAFSAKPGQVSEPMNLGQNWVVYEVVSKTEADPAEFEKQKKTITDNLVQSKRALAFDAFRTSLDARLKADGKLKIMTDKMKGFGDLNSPLNFPNQ